MGDKALRRYRLVLYPPYVPIGHDVCNTYILGTFTQSLKILMVWSTISVKANDYCLIVAVT